MVLPGGEDAWLGAKCGTIVAHEMAGRRASRALLATSGRYIPYISRADASGRDEGRRVVRMAVRCVAGGYA